MKKRIHMHLDNDIFKSFKDFCSKKQMNFSNKIEELMNKELTTNNQRPSLLKYSQNTPPRFEASKPISYIKQQITQEQNTQKQQSSQPSYIQNQQPIYNKPIEQSNQQPIYNQPKKSIPTIAQLRYRKGL